MSNTREILEPNPPQVLYHYTTLAGLLGIIATRDIWANHTQYLNDKREFRHAIDVIKEEIALMKNMIEHAPHKARLDEMETAIQGLGSMNVCVCSFSEQPDMLSQWRAYGEGAGFCIGFSGAFLKALSKENDCWLVRCIYDEAEQRAWMQTLTKDVIQEHLVRNVDDLDDEGWSVPGGNLVAYLNRYAPILKHKSFAEEKEWRIISRPLSSRRLEFRPGRSMLIPYYRFPLGTSPSPFRIEEIIVGPTPHPDESLQSLKSFLLKHGLKTTGARSTTTQFRNW
jgi:hypothetical protein